jgi:glycosyltransferase involved in cell wall biosynthesis
VLRLTSVFPVPDAALADGAAAYDPVGGMQNHTGQLSAALDSLGFRQTVVTAFRPSAPRNQLLGERGRVIRVGVPTRWVRQGYGPAAAAAVSAVRGRFDLVHAHLGEDAAVLPVALAAARRWSAPLVVTVHLSPRHTLAVSGPRSAFLRVVGGGIETMTVRRAAAVITLTDRLAAVLRAGGVPTDRVHAIPSGVRIARYEEAVEPATLPRPAVVFVGRLHRQKGVDTLVTAVRRLPSDTMLTLVGDGPERRAIERQAREMGIAERVRITGFVPHADVPALLAAADVVVLPSRYEELGTALVEAMAAGRPIVATAVGGIPEVVRDGVGGLLVPADDPAALAAAIGRILADPALAARLAAGARERAAGYDWDRLAERTAAVYETVLGRR